MRATREDVLRYRVHVQELDRAAADPAILDLGVQDTGPDGARWALALRGADPDPAGLLLAWTLRGAPHAYRRRQARQVAAATAPYSEADARKRIFDAARPLTAAGIDTVDALDAIAEQMRDIVTRPTVKGDMSRELTERMPQPYRRYCGPCDAIHLYEQPFRLAALRAGLELEPGTSPPVLRRIPRWAGPAKKAPPALDPIRAVLHLLGPATAKQVAGYIDAPVKDVAARWPDDTVEVEVGGERRSVLADDAEALADPADVSGVVRLLGPFDLFLQGRDRELVVPDEAHRKDLWRSIGRPGGILVDHEIRGTWRPRTRGKKLTIAVDPWDDLPELTEQAEMLAAFRGVTFTGFTDS